MKLPATPAAGTFVVVKNNAGSTLKVWPDAAATINAISSNADLPVLTNAACLAFRHLHHAMVVRPARAVVIALCRPSNSRLEPTAETA